MAEPGVPFPRQVGEGGGPEVPFPLSAEGRDQAPKYGFCRDCPFPSHTTPQDLKVAEQKLNRQLGHGSYAAHEIADVLTITATGLAPNFSTIVQLVQLPIMIFPPRFALYFTTPEVVLPAVRAFKIDVSLMVHQRIEEIVVQDADGIHAVKVQNF